LSSDFVDGLSEVHGDARALLQVGSGFHPDFSGRENVYGYLAYLGITGKEADNRFSEIVDFAELEEYIEQPLKTYSTGMAVRLMFATSTSVAPDILVLDEVLSVGDAYFSHKSFERIKELSDRNGTTLLLVSHDIYSAARLCPRMIWLDRGQVLIDGASSKVITAYEDSIRDQEEQRLRKRKQNRLDELARTASDKRTHLIVEIRGRNNQPQPRSVYFSRIELRNSGKVLSSLPEDSPFKRGGVQPEVAVGLAGKSD
jgi:homopolymeric O-antigen transport system ATP-binding protein